MKARARLVEIATSEVTPPRWRRRLASFCGRALRMAGAREWDVSLLLCGDARIAELNRRFRGKAGATDVLSFPREENASVDAVRGDIAISLETLRRNAAAFGCTRDDEVKRLVVHGLLHLAGMDHGRGKGPAMLALQERLLDEARDVHVIGGHGR